MLGSLWQVLLIPHFEINFYWEKKTLLSSESAHRRRAARMYGLVAEDAAPGGATAMARCRDTVERMQGRIRAEDLFAMPATSSASGFKTKSTVGMILNGCTIDSLVVGGPVRDARAARACLSASAAAGRRAGGGRDWGDQDLDARGARRLRRWRASSGMGADAQSFRRRGS